MGFLGRKRAPSVPHPRKEPRFDGPLTLERLEQIFQDSRGKVTPFNGKHCKGQAAATMVDGVFVMKDGVVCKK